MLKNFLLPGLFLFVITASAQSDSIANNDFRIAEDLAKKAKPDSAIIYYEKAAKQFQAFGSAEKFIDSYNQIGKLLVRQDKYEKAKMYLDKALLAGRSLSDTNNLGIAMSYIHLGVMYAANEDFGRSLICHNRCLSIRLLKLGENNAEVATSYGNIGNVYFRSKNYDKAIDAHLKAMKIRETLFGVKSAEVIESYANLGHAYKEQRQFLTALEYYDKALQNKIIQRGEGHKDLSKYYKNMSDVYFMLDNKSKGNFYKTKSEEVLK